MVRECSEKMLREKCQENVEGNMPRGCSRKIERCRTAGGERLKKIPLNCNMHIIYGGNIDG